MIDINELEMNGVWLYNIGDFSMNLNEWIDLSFPVHKEIEIIDNLSGFTHIEMGYIPPRIKCKIDNNYYIFNKDKDMIDLSIFEFRSLRIFGKRAEALEDFESLSIHFLTDEWSAINGVRRKDVFKEAIKNDKKIFSYIETKHPELLI
jgi:hypothetical protein